MVAALSFFALAVANQAATNDALAKANEVQRNAADTQKKSSKRGSNRRNGDAARAAAQVADKSRSNIATTRIGEQ